MEGVEFTTNFHFFAKIFLVFNFFSGMLLPQNSLGSSTLYKGPWTSKVWKSSDLCKKYYCQDCLEVVLHCLFHFSSNIATQNGINGTNLVDSEEAEFKRPTLPPLSKPTIQQHQAFRQQLVNLMPKYNMRKGRPISRPKRWVS